MQNPYDQYMKNQPKISKKNKKPEEKGLSVPLAPAIKNSMKSRQSISLGWILSSMAGLSLSLYVFVYTDEVIILGQRIGVGVSRSLAADGEEIADDGGKKRPEEADSKLTDASGTKVDAEQLTMKNTSVFNALKEKQRELDKKERHLAQLEEELQKQKEEIERQLREMQEMRRNISSKLDTKVTADEESVDKLVGVYSKMKPQNAALILSQIDEGLAVQIFGKMKKESVAAILNYVEPKKAQYLSEKFIGLGKSK